MPGAEAQAGFYYQNVVAALYALDLIELGSRLRSITLENPAGAKYIDDLIVRSDDRTKFIQVRWSADDSSAYTLHNLTTPDDETSPEPLIAKLAAGFRAIAGEVGGKEIVLLSTRRAGTSRRPAKGYDKSLADFVEQFHDPYVHDEQCTDLRAVSGFSEYQTILGQLQEASGLADLDEFGRFLKCLRFELGQPDRDTMVMRLHARLSELGIERTQYALLLDHIVRWSIARATIERDEVLRVLGLLDHFVDRLSQSFPVDREQWVATPAVFDALDRAIRSLDQGFVFLEGEPGIGKSTALSMYQASRQHIAFGYFCLIPNETALGSERLEAGAFIRSLCVGLRNAFPDADLPRPYGDYDLVLLNQWLMALSRQNGKVVFIVDGLDHLHRKLSAVMRPLTTVLEGGMPPNVLIILSAQYAEALPAAIRGHIAGNPLRHISVPRFDGEQVEEFLRLRGVNLAPSLLPLAAEISGGVPIYLVYLAGQLAEMTHYEQERFLRGVPSLRDRSIDEYHSYLWSTICNDEVAEVAVYALAVLAARQEFTTPEDLLDLLRILRVQGTTLEVDHALRTVGHVLRVSDARSYAIRHNGFREFVAEQTHSLSEDINEAIVTWYAAQPDRDQAWRHRFRHLLELGRHEEIIEACDDEWLRRAWEHHRPLSEIARNVDIAWEAASARQDLVQFVRIALLRQRVALVRRHLDLAEFDGARFVLDIGRPQDALRAVWDGTRPTCGPVDFARFLLHHQRRVDRVPPEHIVEAGLRERPRGCTVAELRQYCRACVYVRDPLSLIADIASLAWTTTGQLSRVSQPVGEEERRDLNLSLQLAVANELGLRNDVAGLRQVWEATDRVPEAVREYARGTAALALARGGELNDATDGLREARLEIVPEQERVALLLALAQHRIWNSEWAGSQQPPRLPDVLMEDSEQSLNRDLTSLYDRLRMFFLTDSEGFAWLEARVTGLPEPMRTLTHALGRLARAWRNRVVEPERPRRDLLGEVQRAIEALDLAPSAFGKLGWRSNYARFTYIRESRKLLAAALEFAEDFLPDSDLLRLAEWWLHLRDGHLLRTYPEASRELAVRVHSRTGRKGIAAVKAILPQVEGAARSDEETTTMVPELLACAAAWGRCGFADEVQRLWSELLDIACGADSHKDYQPSQIVPALRLAHEQDPEGTPSRLAEQLALAHQLVGAADGAVADAVEEFAVSACPVSPGLALPILEREEQHISRSRALRSVVLELLKRPDVDLRWLWALAATMGRWENYADYNEQTLPAMFAVYSASIERGNYAAARQAYDLARFIFLVEKNTPSEIGRWAGVWAGVWARAGEAPSDVLADAEQYCENSAPVDEEMAATVSEEPDAIVLHEAARDGPARLEACLDDLLEVAVRRERERELDRAIPDWHRVFSSSLGHELTDAEGQAIAQCVTEIHPELMGVPGDSLVSARESIRTIVGRLVGNIADRLGAELSFAEFLRSFDLDDWTDGFVRAGSGTYELDRLIGRRLTQWIESAPFADLDAWEDFLHRRCPPESRMAGLLAIARRIAKLDRDRAITLLLEAARSNWEWFFEHQSLARSICRELVQLDQRASRELVLDIFRKEYERYADTIVYRLHLVLEFADAFPGVDYEALYEAWAEYNRRLAAGLSRKPTDSAWLTVLPAGTFSDHCLDYLLGLLDYPVVDVRCLALAELRRLAAQRVLSVNSLLDRWPDLSAGQKEHVATLLFSVALGEPRTVPEWGRRVVELARDERHANLRWSVADAIITAARLTTGIDQDLVTEAHSLVTRPTIVATTTPPIRPSGLSPKVPCLPYHLWVLEILGKAIPPDFLESRVQAHLSARCPNPQEGFSEEEQIYREYNINTNFDEIELSGPYHRALQETINAAVWDSRLSHVADEGALLETIDLLRLYDPTDLLIQPVSRPARVDWITEGLSDDDFLAFADWERLRELLLRRNADWATIFEHCEQRIGERGTSDNTRACRIHVAVFGLNADRGKVMPGSLHDATVRLRNRYRFELRVNSSGPGVVPLSGVTPIVQVSGNALRGRHRLDTASLRPRIASRLGLAASRDDWLGYERGGIAVVRSTEWQEAFDQGRRRHEPRSSGFLLEMKREPLARWAREARLDIWVYLVIERTTDRYKPEAQMTWVKQRDTFRFPVEHTQ